MWESMRNVLCCSWFLFRAVTLSQLFYWCNTVQDENQAFHLTASHALWSPSSGGLLSYQALETFILRLTFYTSQRLAFRWAHTSLFAWWKDRKIAALPYHHIFCPEHTTVVSCLIASLLLLHLTALQRGGWAGPPSSHPSPFGRRLPKALQELSRTYSCFFPQSKRKHRSCWEVSYLQGGTGPGFSWGSGLIPSVILPWDTNAVFDFCCLLCLMLLQMFFYSLPSRTICLFIQIPIFLPAGTEFSLIA